LVWVGTRKRPHVAVWRLNGHRKGVVVQNNLPTESALLACITFNPKEAIPSCIEKNITKESFYSLWNGELYTILMDMYGKGYGLDYITVASELEKVGKLHLSETLDDLLEGESPTLYLVSSYIAILKKEELSRNLTVVGQLLGEHSSEPEEALIEAQEKLISLSPKSETRTKKSIKEAIMEDWNISKNHGPRGIITPWKDVNAKLAGIPSELVTVLAGRRSTGKSSIMATWAHFLGRQGIRVGWLPIEDGAERTWKRLAGIEGDFSVFLRDKGESTDHHLSVANSALERVMSWPIFMADSFMDIHKIRSWATTLKAKEDIQVLFIDGFKDILRSGKMGNSVDEDNYLSTSICAIARALRIPVLVVHHIVKGTEGDKIGLDNIRGSGRIIDDARTVLILQNDGLTYSLDIAKNNHGPEGIVEMRRISNRCMFEQGNVFNARKEKQEKKPKPKGVFEI